MEHIHQIYDRIAKRCISLSSRCTINLINGLYGTNYPIDSEVTYNWTENTDDELHRTLSDTIITINHRYSYHIEFQMTEDGDIILRMFEYGFHHAMNTRNPNVLAFPEPLIVYLYNSEQLPDEYELRITFGSQGDFLYKAPVYKYLEKTLDELNAQKLIVLLPFQLLRLRKVIEKERTPENMNALKNLITHDILNSLNKNVAAGNITAIESMKLGQLIFRLYKHIYGKFEELDKEGVNQLAEDALIFDVDILDYQIRKLEKEMAALESKMQSLESQRQSLESQNQSLESQLKAISRVWKLHSKGYSYSEIAAETNLDINTIINILTSE